MLGETMRDMGIDTNKLRLRAGTFGAEPWTEGMRQQIEELMGIDALDIYGLSETMGPGVAIECKEEKHGLHIWGRSILGRDIGPGDMRTSAGWRGRRACYYHHQQGGYADVEVSHA